jgi:hypothetical protein
MLVCRDKSSATLTSAVKIENRGLAHSLTFSNVTQSGGKFEGLSGKFQRWKGTEAMASLKSWQQGHKTFRHRHPRTRPISLGVGLWQALFKT